MFCLNYCPIASNHSAAPAALTPLPLPQSKPTRATPRRATRLLRPRRTLLPARTLSGNPQVTCLWRRRGGILTAALRIPPAMASRSADPTQVTGDPLWLGPRRGVRRRWCVRTTRRRRRRRRLVMRKRRRTKMRGQGGIRRRPPAAGGDGPARPCALDQRRDLAASPSTDLDDPGDPVRPQVGRGC